MTYMVHVVPGLEEQAKAEIERVLPGTQVVRILRHFDERTSVLLVRHAGSVTALLDLKLAEDVFALAAERDDVAGGWDGLKQIRTLVASSPSLPAAADAALRVRGRGGRRITVRVIARKAGSQAFRRVDLQHTAERALLDRYPGWRLIEDDARLELWVHLVGRAFLAGFRLSDITMRQRDYRRESIPAALKPTIAHAMAVLSEPREDDVFLDPMCGSGTILIERAQAERYRLLLGGDSDPVAVAATRANIGPRYKPVEIRQWDARALPLGSGSVSALVCNLPFGKQIGTPSGVRFLYPSLLREWTRVLTPGGRMVLLTGDRALLTRVLGRQPELILYRTISVLVRGYRSTIFVIHRGGGS